MADGTEARAAAVRLILGVTDGGMALSDQIARGAFAGLEPSGRARAQRLTLSTLRLLGPVDQVLKPLVRREPPA